jgi:hypothetical protein
MFASINIHTVPGKSAISNIILKMGAASSTEMLVHIYQNHDITSQKTAVFVVTAVKTSQLANYFEVFS